MGPLMGPIKTPSLFIVNCISPKIDLWPTYVHMSDMNVTDHNLFLMKIEHHYNVQTKLTPCINNIIELAVTYLPTCCF